LRSQRIELPSWAFANSGTRFKVFGQPGVPRISFEKVADAAQVFASLMCSRRDGRGRAGGRVRLAAL